MQMNMTKQNIFILGEGTLFDEGVTNLLTQRTDFFVSYAKFSDDLDFLDTVRQKRPDVILVCESDSLDPAHILNLVSSHPIMMGLLVVIIRLYNSMIDIYEGPMGAYEMMSFRQQRIMAETEEDLLNVLRRK